MDIRGPDDMKVHLEMNAVRCSVDDNSCFFSTFLFTDFVILCQSTDRHSTLSSMPAICLSTGSQLRCYQTTSCLRPFSSSLTTFEAVNWRYTVCEPQTTVKTKGVDNGCGCSDISHYTSMGEGICLIW